MDIREYTSPTLPVAQFVERYVDTDHYDAGCRGCDNYGYVPPMISPSPATGADSGRRACGACSSGSPRKSRPAAIIRRSWRSDYGSCSPGRPGR